MVDIAPDMDLGHWQGKGRVLLANADFEPGQQGSMFFLPNHGNFQHMNGG